ncbi:MAG: hypothetical protein ACOH1N_00670 [Lutibacter sp.]
MLNVIAFDSKDKSSIFTNNPAIFNIIKKEYTIKRDIGSKFRERHLNATTINRQLEIRKA